MPKDTSAKSNYYRIHNELVNRILILLSSNRLGTYWANATGAVVSKSNRLHRFGLKGSADILGMSAQGRFVGIEIKTGSARQSKAQVAFQKMCEKNNALYLVIHSEEEFLSLIHLF